MKQPVVIWQKPEYKRFGRVQIAAYFPKEAEVPTSFSEIKKFDHHQWSIPEGVNPFAYKAYQCSHLPKRIRMVDADSGNKTDEVIMLENELQRWVQNQTDTNSNPPQVNSNECIYIHSSNGEIAVLIPKTHEVGFSKEMLEKDLQGRPFVIGVPCFDENGKVYIIDSLQTEADKREWTIPNELDLDNYWCPIPCYGPTRQHKDLEDALAHCFVNNLLLNNHIA